MCHVTSSAALLTLQVSATVSCFFLAPGLVILAWPRCQICPPPGELLTVSRLTRLATKVRSASGSLEMTGASGGESNRAMIPGDNGSYQRMSWSDDGLITLTMLIDGG